MAQTRVELHSKLVAILGSEYVYFQPPSTVKMKYPCIIYKRDEQDTKFANNRLYMGMQRYSVTVVDPDPDSLIPSKLMALRYCSFVTHYPADNLNHDVYTLYF